MGSHEQPHDETIESDLYKSFQRKAWPMLMVTNSFVVMILNSFLLPITEVVGLGTSQSTISTRVVYYSKFEQEPSAFIKVLDRVVAYENLKTKERSPLVIHKSGRGCLRERSLTRAFHYSV